MKILRTALTVLVLLTATQTSAAEATLERVVIVERHGVRPPTKAAADLAKYAQNPWPEWPVPPGELTAHGADAMTLMGGAFLRTYIKSGLFADGGCPAGVFVWSDSGDQRTRASGDAILKGFGCTAPSQHLSAGSEDPMFDAVAAKVCTPDAAQAKAAAEKRLASSMAGQRNAYDKGRKVLQSVLTPNGCGKPGQRECLIGDGENSITVKNGDVRMEGPLAVASSLSENLLLEYSEGMPRQDVGWGNGAGALSGVLPLHNLYADVMRRNPALASYRSALLAQQIVDLLNHRPSPFQGAAPVPADAKLVVFLGHDGNLSNLSGLIGTPWSLPGQPDATAPGTALAFELWRAADGTKVVKLRVLYQTLEDTRGLAKLVTPRSRPLALSGCPKGICSLAELTKRLEENIAPACLKK